MWNCLDLKCPSQDFSEYPPQDQYLAEELRNFVTVLSTAANTLTSENPLWNELEVLNNIQQKYKRLLRCDKCLIFLRRVAHCIKKMVLLNLSKSYLDLAERFLIGFQDISMTLKLPSRQQLEYLLIRTLSASKLVCAGIKYSRETFCYLIQKLKVGHLILDLVMAASVIARLNILLRATLEQLCSVYQQMLLWRYKLKRGQFQWTSKLDLPQDLKEWLKSFESGSLKPFPMSQADVNMLSKLLTTSNENQDSDTESIVVLNEVTDHQAVNITAPSSSAGVNDTTKVIDYGEVVSRKKTKKDHQLTPLQKSLLQRIVQTQSFRDLEKLCQEIFNYPQDHFPRALTDAKKRIVNKLFVQIKNTVSTNKFNKIFEKEPMLLKNAHLVFCKHLGFTKVDVEMCKKDLLPKVAEESATELVPVKTLKGLKNLYSRLCEILKISKETKKLRKLQRFFKQRRADIKLLKKNGEKITAKKLIFCTSKLLLALCQK